MNLTSPLRAMRKLFAFMVTPARVLDVPVVYLSVLWWRTLHQTPSSPETVARPMLLALWLAMASFTLLFAFFLTQRFRLARAQSRVELMEVDNDW